MVYILTIKRKGEGHAVKAVLLNLVRPARIDSVSVVERKDGYSIVIKMDGNDEPLRAQHGHVRVYPRWETMKEKLDKAGILNFSVIGRA